MNSGWFANEDFWETLFPLFYTNSRLDVSSEVESITKLCSLTPPANVLDMPCGPGRHALELTRRGFQVTGVDLSLSYLSRAQESAQKEQLDIEFVRSDMRSFYRPENFGAVLILYSSLGYFSSRDDDKNVLRNAYRSLKTNGRLLLDLRGKENIRRSFVPKGSFEIEGVAYTEERNVYGDVDRIDTTWSIGDPERPMKRFSMSVCLYSADEIAGLLKAVGFHSATVFGDLSGAPLSADSACLCVVAHK